MGTIKDIFDVIVSVTGMSVEESRKQRQRFYDCVVEPSFVSMQKVHKNYIEKFTRLLAILELEDLPNLSLVHWLREQGVEYCEERHRLKSFTWCADSADEYLRVAFPGRSVIRPIFRIWVSGAPYLLFYPSIRY